MTVQANARRVTYDGDGVITEFVFEFKVFADANLRVYVSDDDGETFDLQTLDSAYTVQRNTDQDDDPGGTVTFGVAPAVDDQIVIKSRVAVDQTTVVNNLGGFYPQILERMSDKSTVQVQEVAEDAARGLRAPEVEGPMDELPAAAARANLFLMFDADGNPTVGLPPDLVIDNDGDGTTDMHGTIQAQLDALATFPQLTVDGNGFNVTFSGTFLLSDGIVVPAALRGVTFQGGQFIADESSPAWTTDKYIWEFAARRCTMDRMNFDSSNVCAGVGNTGGQNIIDRCRAIHYTEVGFDMTGSAGGTLLHACRAQQHPSTGDATSDADYTAVGIRQDTGDDKIVANVCSDNGINFRATENSGSTLIRGNHFFNGGQFADKIIVSITQASPGVVTVTGHGFSNGQAVHFDVAGMTELDGETLRAAGVTANTFTLIDRAGAPIDTTGYGAFTSGTLAPLRTNPKNIRCDYASGGMQFLGNYIGNGEIDLYTDNVIFDNNFGLNITQNAYMAYWCCLFGQPGVNHPSSFRWRNWRFGSSAVNNGTVPQLVLAPNEALDEYADDWSVLSPAGANAWQFLALQDRITIARPYDDESCMAQFVSPNQDTDGTMVGFIDSDTTDVDDPPRIGSHGDRLQIEAPVGNTLALRLKSPTENSVAIDFEDSTSSVNPRIESFGNKMNIRGVAGVVFLNCVNTVPVLVDNRDASFAFTSNTNLRISFKGNDGTTRSVDLTLA